MAARRSGRTNRSQAGPSTEDTFVLGIVQIVDWARKHQRGVTLAALAALAVIAGLVYYRDYQRNLTTRAATQLSQLEASLGSAGGPEQAISDLQTYLSRFGGTPSAEEARLLLARIQLGQGHAQDALETVKPLASRPLDTPMGYAASRLQADAYAASGQRGRAIQLLDETARNARFPFQRHQAAAEEASLLVQAGRYDSAASIYRSLSRDTTATAEAGGNLYGVRLGEVLALKATGARPPQGPPLDTTSAADTTVPGGLTVPGSAAGGAPSAPGGRPDSSSGPGGRR